MMIKNIFYTLLTSVFLCVLAACNKGKDDFIYKMDMVPVIVKGYNGSGEELEIKIDTTKGREALPTGIFYYLEPYTFPVNQQTSMLRITERNTGKQVMEREIKKEAGPTTINLFYMHGKAGDLPEKPEPESGKITVSYLFMPTLTNYTQPVDIVLGKYYFIPKVFEEITRIKNVKPYEFSKSVTISTFQVTGQQYNGQPTAVLFKAYIYKAGTNEFYTEGTGYTWHATSSSAPTPLTPVMSSTMYIFKESSLGNSIRFIKDFEL
ncbi:hypothetical protein [Chitinophaga nivalis]|uniref:DUF3823 domain-containing protein n=1 Tax=Chitinophaga nivalis TaxID=2991709 RepID=A0ABT3IF90_9BACT|nr:hypothetical protein [Chitinophaga nivalis]MCW3467838.1 hypothetical protein [Chitinophaga nivalis]MCW3482470.1 hypothetical protein [Chitinophaga nivalis]